MKIRHNVPTSLIPASDPITPEYQAEVDLTMARAASAYRKAEQRLVAAEKRLAKAERLARTMAGRRRVEELHMIVELRRLELEQTHRLMVATGAPSTSRGVKSFRPVPKLGGQF